MSEITPEVVVWIKIEPKIVYLEKNYKYEVCSYMKVLKSILNSKF